jgi:hypothetical protein
MDCPESVEYITNDLTGTVHLKPLDPGAYRTLCGQQIDHWHTFGDETLSGFLATCKKCRAIFRGEPMNRPYGVVIVKPETAA